jgi:hypothetical protein
MNCNRTVELLQLRKRVDAFLGVVEPAWDNWLSTPDAVYPGNDFVVITRSLFEPVKNLYLSNDSSEAFQIFRGILGNGNGPDAARHMFFVVGRLSWSGDNEHEGKMRDIVAAIGRDAFGKRMNWLKIMLFHDTPGWNGDQHAVYCKVDGFSRNALNSDSSFFDDFIAIH